MSCMGRVVRTHVTSFEIQGSIIYELYVLFQWPYGNPSYISFSRIHAQPHSEVRQQFKHWILRLKAIKNISAQNDPFLIWCPFLECRHNFLLDGISLAQSGGTGWFYSEDRAAFSFCAQLPTQINLETLMQTVRLQYLSWPAKLPRLQGSTEKDW